MKRLQEILKQPLPKNEAPLSPNAKKVQQELQRLWDAVDAASDDDKAQTAALDAYYKYLAKQLSTGSGDVDKGLIKVLNKLGYDVFLDPEDAGYVVVKR